jgi:hypothetical protein
MSATLRSAPNALLLLFWVAQACGSSDGSGAASAGSGGSGGLSSGVSGSAPGGNAGGGGADTATGGANAGATNGGTSSVAGSAAGATVVAGMGGSGGSGGSAGSVTPPPCTGPAVKVTQAGAKFTLDNGLVKTTTSHRHACSLGVASVVRRAPPIDGAKDEG